MQRALPLFFLLSICHLFAQADGPADNHPDKVAYLNNARQVPMLPDWAIVDVRTPPGNVWPGRIVDADFFDERWQLKPPAAIPLNESAGAAR